MTNNPSPPSDAGVTLSEAELALLAERGNCGEYDAWFQRAIVELRLSRSPSEGPTAHQIAMLIAPEAFEEPALPEGLALIPVRARAYRVADAILRLYPSGTGGDEHTLVLVQAVRRAAATFREYERIHADKGNLDGDVKARKNAALAEEMEAALASLDNIPSDGNGWQGIDSAPKDGTRILVYTVHEPDDYCPDRFARIQTASWDKGCDLRDFERPGGWAREYIGEPTHWRPLPPSPKDGDQ